jgi:nitroreductase
MTAVAEVERYNRTGKISGVISPQLAFEHERLAPERIERFAKSRHSIRNFDRNHRVSGSDVRRVIQLAAESTPSVCNRRPFRAYFFNDPDTIHQLLKLQNGNRGFGHTVPALLIVTTRRASFTGSGERNQRWIDGGLFAMTIVWVLHAYGIGSCFLNWSETHKKSSLCRRVADIPASEDIITFIAMGYPAEGCRRALSPSRPLNDILVDRTN